MESRSATPYTSILSWNTTPIKVTVNSPSFEDVFTSDIYPQPTPSTSLQSWDAFTSEAHTQAPTSLFPMDIVSELYPQPTSQLPPDAFTSELHPQPTRIIFTACFCVLFVLGLTGNVLVMAVVCRDKELWRSSTGAFIGNLALADLLVLAVCLPTSVAELHSPPLFWVLPPSLCKAVPFIESLVQHASVLTIFAIALERHHAVLRPLSAARACTRGRAALTCVAVWAVALLLTSPLLVISQLVEIEVPRSEPVGVCLNDVQADWKRLYVLSCHTLLFFVPLALLLLIFRRIARRLLVADAALHGLQRRHNPNIAQRRQVVVMLATVVVVFFFCLLPYHLLSLWTLLAHTPIPFEMYFNLVFSVRVLVYLNSSVNPVLYNLSSTRFRSSLRQLLGMYRQGRPLSRTSSLRPTDGAQATSLSAAASPATARTSVRGGRQRCVVYKFNKFNLPTSVNGSLHQKNGRVNRASFTDWNHRDSSRKGCSGNLEETKGLYKNELECKLMTGVSLASVNTLSTRPPSRLSLGDLSNASAQFNETSLPPAMKCEGTSTQSSLRTRSSSNYLHPNFSHSKQNTATHHPLVNGCALQSNTFHDADLELQQKSEENTSSSESIASIQNYISHGNDPSCSSCYVRSVATHNGTSECRVAKPQSKLWKFRSTNFTSNVYHKHVSQSSKHDVKRSQLESYV